MKTIRYSLLMLFMLAPGLVFAQSSSDSLNIIVDGQTFPGWGWAAGTPFVEGQDIGPLPIVAAEPYIGCLEDPGNPEADPNGFIPFLENAEAVAGNILLVSRGDCQFATKVKAGAAAGAAAVIIGNNVEGVPNFGGECEPSVCDVPATAVEVATRDVLFDAAKFETDVTIVPIRVASAPPNAVLDNGTIQTTVFHHGFIGGDPSFAFGEGFVFNGANGLFVSSALIGINGEVTSNPYDGASEFTALQAPTPLTAPFDPPFTAFDQAIQTAFSSPLGATVTLTGYASSTAPNNTFIVFDMDVENTSGGDLNDVYLGFFADWDAGATSVDDEAGVNTDLNLVYVYDPVEEVPYYGVAALGEGVTLSGYNADATTADDAQLFEALTTATEPAAGGAERAAVSGVGPFNIPAGTSVSVRFAFVGGEDEGALFANAQAAQDAVDVAAEVTTPEGTFVLESAYPNPFSARTTIGFELPTAQDVRLTVYDVLGRQVATLVDGVRQAGPQTVVFDASSLPSGMYIYRLEAGSTQLMERVTLVR